MAKVLAKEKEKGIETDPIWYMITSYMVHKSEKIYIRPCELVLVLVDSTGCFGECEGYSPKYI